MQYYVIKNNKTGHYWRGKGGQWGDFFNQASIYRIEGQAKSTVRDLVNRGFDVSIVPIIIMEGAVVLDEAI